MYWKIFPVPLYGRNLTLLIAVPIRQIAICDIRCVVEINEKESSTPPSMKVSNFCLRNTILNQA